MRDITINFLNLIQNKTEDQHMDTIIHDYVQNIDPNETVPIHVLDRSSLDNEQFLKRHSRDLASFLHKAVELESPLMREYVGYIDFSIFSVGGTAVSSMDLEEQERIWLEIKLRLTTCPFLSDSSFVVEVFDELIWIEWTMPMPIKTSSFSKEQLKKLESNILHYFSRYFDTQNCTLKLYYLDSFLSSIKCNDGADYYYDKVFFPNVFLECFGLSVDYKLD